MPIELILPGGGRKNLRVSCTQIDKFTKSPQEWFDEYILRLPRFPQTQAMSVGSGFDSYCKHKLCMDLFGPNDEQTIAMAAQFESSVEEHNRDFARNAGAYCLKRYIEIGRYAELLAFLETQDAVYFESSIEVPVGIVVAEIDREMSKRTGRAFIAPGTARPDTVDFIMKPDCFSIRVEGGTVIPTILDWKVNGFCSKKGGTPEKGYYKGPEGINAVCHTGNSPLPGKWKDQLHAYSYGVMMKHGIIPMGSRLDAEAPTVTVSIDQLCTIPKPNPMGDVAIRHIDVYQYVSCNNTNVHTDMHNRLSYMISCLTCGWWDPGVGDYFTVESWGRGRAAINSEMLAMSRPR